jgi:hypothetical protein
MSPSLHVEHCTQHSDWWMGPAETATLDGLSVLGSLEWQFNRSNQEQRD